MALICCGECPRGCCTNKAISPGFCGGSDNLNIASICLHRGEEPPISGKKGICNIFFPGCNLSCIYCQNDQISRRDILYPKLNLNAAADQIIEIAETGSGSVGFVSPSHYIKQMIKIAEIIKKKSPHIVLVMNTNCYDKAETIRGLDGLIDVYLPDYKYSDSRLSAEYSNAPDYSEIAIRALREMRRQKGTNLNFDDESFSLKSGLIIRHLILPGSIENTRGCLNIIAEEISPSVHISLMSQYNPTAAVAAHPLLGRKITPREYDEALEIFYSLGFSKGWIQDLSSSLNYNPDFNLDHPFEGYSA